MGKFQRINHRLRPTPLRTRHTRLLRQRKRRSLRTRPRLVTHNRKRNRKPLQHKRQHHSRRIPSESPPLQRRNRKTIQLPSHNERNSNGFHHGSHLTKQTIRRHLFLHSRIKNKTNTHIRFNQDNKNPTGDGDNYAGSGFSHPTQPSKQKQKSNRKPHKNSHIPQRMRHNNRHQPTGK